tara:strand:+ start:829 stop:1119 length:291 start_codon:yes stop_codon:yes gene_type:complete
MKILIAILISLTFSMYTLAADNTVTLEIPSMNCAMCPITVKKALKKIEGVLAVDVSFETKLVVVKFDNSKTSSQSLIEATTNSGYPSTIFGGEKNE